MNKNIKNKSFIKIEKSTAFLKKTKKIIPGGVNSNVREKHRFVVTNGKGPLLYDLDGNKFIDYCLGFGPVILGHAHPVVTEAVCKALQKGTTFAFTNELEYLVCEKIINLCPWNKMVRLCNSGTDAAQTAYRLAKAYTGKSKSIKIQGDYNGGFDIHMYDITGVDGNKLGRKPLPASYGLIRGADKEIITIPFNNTEVLEAVIDKHKNEIAVLFMEPILGNAASIMADHNYLKRVRELCTNNRIVLVFDEIKTGFRVALGGAQEYYKVYGDLTLYGKAIGNGLPISALAGKKEIMQLLKLKKVHHCGTYYGNLPCCASAYAVLSFLENSNYNELNNFSKLLANGIVQILNEHGIVAQWQGLGGMFGITLGPKQSKDYKDWWKNTNHFLWEKIAQKLEDFGVLHDPFIGLFFLSFAHQKKHLEQTLDKLENVIKNI